MSQDLVESFSGIRGIYGKAITEQLARQYAFCYCQLFPTKRDCLLIGGDSRVSTPALQEAIIKTFQNCGVKTIINVGVVPIQAAEYALQKFKAQGGVYISASHNEPEYNGFKFLKEDGAILYPEQSEKLIKAVHNLKESLPSEAPGSVESFDKHNEAVINYIDYVLEKIGSEAVAKIKNANFKILADPNGGSAINVLDKLFFRLGVEAKIVNNQIGRFNRLVEPNRQSLAPLAKELEDGKFEFACGFDCDADRVELIINPNSQFAKEMGVVVSGHYVLALACDGLLAGTENEIVVVNSATSCLVRDVIKKHQAEMKMVEVGEMNVVKAMEENKSIIGGEGSSSGVIIPPIKCRDGIISIVLILKMLAEKKKTLLEILQGYPKYYSARTKVFCQPEQSIGIKRKIGEYFKEQGYETKELGGETGSLDVFIDNNSFIFFRQSKTESGAFRIHTEGDGKEKVSQMLKQGIEAFNKSTN